MLDGPQSPANGNSDASLPPPYSLLPNSESSLATPNRNVERTANEIPVASDVQEWYQDAQGTKKLVGVRHYVTRTDTLVGISLKYGVEIPLIRKANSLFTDNICTRPYLFIPNASYSHQPTPSPDEERKVAVKRFQIIAKCTDPHEAWSYMDQNDFQMEAALEQYWSDVKWEKEHPRSAKGKKVR